MESYLNNPFPIAGIVSRTFTPRTDERMMVDPEDGETYAVRHIKDSKTEEHDPVQYTKVFTEAHFKIRKLSYTALKIFNYCVKNRYNDTIATSTGYSKKEAENNVSKEALLYYGISIQ